MPTIEEHDEQLIVRWDSGGIFAQPSSRLRSDNVSSWADLDPADRRRQPCQYIKDSNSSS